MRERVRQLWLEEEEETRALARWPASLREWWEREYVQAHAARVSLQAGLAGVLLAVCIILRVPVAALDAPRAAVRSAFTRTYTASMAWRQGSDWAAARGGWKAGLTGLYTDWQNRVAGWVHAVVPATADQGPSSPGNPAAVQPQTGTAAPTGAPAPATAAADLPVSGPNGTAAVPDPAPGAPSDPAAAGPTGAEVIIVNDQEPAAANQGTGAGGHAAEPEAGGQGVRPVSGKVLSAWGWRTQPGGGDPALHEGVDLAAPAGAVVKAMWAGTVAEVGKDPRFGRFVTIDHGGGTQTRYAPLQSAAVKQGEAVKAGQELGRLGSAPAGEAGEDHLHLELLKDGRMVDPMPYLATEGGL